jgi:hypothetical protein
VKGYELNERYERWCGGLRFNSSNSFISYSLAQRRSSVSSTVVLFLGSVFSAVVSGLFWMAARRAEDRGLARATAVAVVVFCVAALYFGSQL